MSNLILKQDEKLKRSNVDVNQIMEKVLLAGDLATMPPSERIHYYLMTCESLGLNSMSKPFDLLTLNGKMILYPNRTGADQLRKIGEVNITLTSQGFDANTGCYTVTARATLPYGRYDEDMGVVYCAGLKGDQLANAQLKAVTKAKRRVTLSVMGLGWVDESEVSSIKDAKTNRMDLETGNIIDPQQAEQGGDSKKLIQQIQPVSNPDNVPVRKPTDKQLIRLRAIQGHNKVSEQQLKTFIRDRFKIESTKDLSLAQYNMVCDTMLNIGSLDNSNQKQDEIDPRDFEGYFDEESL